MAPARGLASPGRRWRTAPRISTDAALLLAVCGAALTVVLLTAQRLGAVALTAAFLAGATVERYRQGRRKRPLGLADTPGAWAGAVRESVGLPYSLAAGLGILAALALLMLPPGPGDHGSDEPVTRDARGVARAGQAAPQIQVVHRRAERRFVLRGLSFRVFATGDPPPNILPLRPAGGGARWVPLGVDIRNLGRRRFAPNALAYRLRDGRERSYWPETGGGTGPASLARTGRLRRGQGARMRLTFRVPHDARRLTLVFEPDAAGPLQVRVPFGRSAPR
jgi:hypothetical protein